MNRMIAALLLIMVSGASFASAQHFQDGLKAYLKGETEQALQIWQELARAGDVRSQKQLGQYYLTDQGQRDYEKSIHWYREAASQGDEDAVGHLKNVLALFDTWRTLADRIGEQTAYETMALRDHLQEGMDTQCGFVIEVKDKVVLLQTATRPRWFKKSDIYPEDAFPCDYLSHQVASR